MKTILPLIISLAVMGCNSSTPVKEDLGYKGQTSEGTSIEELLAHLTSNPDVQVRVEQGWSVAEVKSEHALYSFTPENHPAHPSYVKREVVEKDGVIYIETSARCGAEKRICDQLIRDFIELDNKVKETINGS